jgi:hypothetical protein
VGNEVKTSPNCLGDYYQGAPSSVHPGVHLQQLGFRSVCSRLKSSTAVTLGQHWFKIGLRWPVEIPALNKRGIGDSGPLRSQAHFALCAFGKSFT